MIEQRNSNQIEVHEGGVNKRGLEMKVEIITHQILDLEVYAERNDSLKALRKMVFNDLEDMVLRMSLTYKQLEYILD